MCTTPSFCSGDKVQVEYTTVPPGRTICSADLQEQYKFISGMPRENNFLISSMDRGMGGLSIQILHA